MSPFQVLNRSSVDGSRVIQQPNNQVAFLDEFRIVLTHDKVHSTGPELLVFNTFVPQDHPGNLRRFRFPPKYFYWRAYVHLDHDRSLGTVNRDGPLVTDPTQAILVVGLTRGPSWPGTLLILRVQPLIESVCSSGNGVQILWDRWRRGSVAIEISQYDQILLTAIHGAHVLVMYHCDDIVNGNSLHLFDFSRKGSAALPLSDENDGGTERRAMFEGRRSRMFEVGRQVKLWIRQSIGDCLVTDVVSLLSLIPSHEAL